MKRTYPSIQLLFILVCIAFLGQAQTQDTLLKKYPGTEQRWEEVYQNQQKVKENIYHQNGTPWMTVQYRADENQYWKWYYDNGNPYWEARIIDNLIQGSYKIWYENGQLAEVIDFKDHRENGEATFFYSSGQIAAQGSYRMGEMVGPWLFFDKDGNPAEGNWQWVFGADRDKVRMQGQVKAGVPVGVWDYKSTDGIRPVRFKQEIKK